VEARESNVIRYGCTLLLITTLVLVSAFVGPRPHFPMSFLYLAATMLVAFYGGLGPAILSGVISSTAIDYFYVEPVGMSILVWVLVLSTSVSLSLLAEKARVGKRQAEEATRAREQTLAIVSHDLRQPLTTIALELELLRRSESSPHAERALSMIKKMQGLVEDLLEASRAGRYSLELKSRNAAELARDCLDDFRRQAERRQIDLNFKTEENLPPIRADERRFRQMLGNVLDNALKYTPENGNVRVEVARGPEKSVEIRVFDSGPGIPKENLSQIFERNWQAKDTAHLGAGLGLYIARGIAHAHGAKIWAVPQTRRGACIAMRFAANI
jgi:signal transduction histidine kinase